MDFGALPPEINSGRMYSGPGSGPLLTAAGAWDGVAAELTSTASSYYSVVSGLTDEAWSGPTAASMTAAIAPYMAWMRATAAQAEEAAAQTRAAAAAYDAAFTATVPPPVIAANRSLLMTLIATNILGQNTAAIAATEAHYAEMWAEDAAAMYGYAGASASAARLTPFTLPPSTVNTAGLGAQAAALAHAAAGVGAQTQMSLAQLIPLVPPALEGLAVSGSAPVQATGPLFSVLDFLAGPLSPISLFGIGGIPYLLAIQCVMLPMNGASVLASLAKAGSAGVLGAQAPIAGGLGAQMQLVSSASGTGSVSAGLGNASLAGQLSVPQGWGASTAPAVKVVTAALPGPGPGAAAMVAADGESAMVSDLALGGLAGRAIGATGGAASRAGKSADKTAAAKAAKPTQATIIVIPSSAED